jgi:hypothetical protein
MGVEPFRLDLLKGIDGVTFAEAWEGRKRVRFRGSSVNVIGLRAYVKNKRASGRPKDLLDIELLREVKRRRQPRRK